MEDIKLNSVYKKIQYKVSWIFFILLGSPLFWLIALGLFNYGKHTIENKNKEKDILKLTYQKFIYSFGLILTYLAIFLLILSLFVDL